MMRSADQLVDPSALTPSYARATNLEDLARLESLPSFRMTPSMMRALNHISSRSADSRERAWAVVGPYGAGKSTFALLVAGILAQPANSGWVSDAIRAEEADPTLHANLEALRSRQYVPVLMQGGSQRLQDSLVAKLIEIDSSHSPPLFNRADRQSLIGRQRKDMESRHVLRVLERAAKGVREAGYSGLIIWCLGKCHGAVTSLAFPS